MLLNLTAILSLNVYDIMMNNYAYFVEIDTVQDDNPKTAQNRKLKTPYITTVLRNHRHWTLWLIQCSISGEQEHFEQDTKKACA